MERVQYQMTILLLLTKTGHKKCGYMTNPALLGSLFPNLVKTQTKGVIQGY